MYHQFGSACHGLDLMKCLRGPTTQTTVQTSVSRNDIQSINIGISIEDVRGPRLTSNLHHISKQVDGDGVRDELVLFQVAEERSFELSGATIQ